MQNNADQQERRSSSIGIYEYDPRFGRHRTDLENGDLFVDRGDTFGCIAENQRCKSGVVGDRIGFVFGHRESSKSRTLLEEVQVDDELSGDDPAAQLQQGHPLADARVH